MLGQSPPSTALGPDTVDTRCILYASVSRPVVVYRSKLASKQLLLDTSPRSIFAASCLSTREGAVSLFDFPRIDIFGLHRVNPGTGNNNSASRVRS
jgi:hypothetical protein